MKKTLKTSLLMLVGLSLLFSCNNGMSSNDSVLEEENTILKTTKKEEEISKYVFADENLKVLNYKTQIDSELYSDIPEIRIEVEGKNKVEAIWYYKKESDEEFQQLESSIITESEDEKVFVTLPVTNDLFEKNKLESVKFYAEINSIIEKKPVAEENTNEVNMEEGLVKPVETLPEYEIVSTYTTDVITVSKVFPKTSLPIMTINVEDNQKINSKEEYLSAEMIIDCDNNVLLEDNIQIKGRGSSSWNADKKSYSVKLSSKKSIFGWSKNKKYVLVPNYLDKTLLRNQFAYYLGNTVYDNLVWTPSSKQVQLVVNGEYLGEYLLVEKIEINENKVNVQSLEDVYKKPAKCKDVNGDGKVDLNDGGFILEYDVRLNENFGFKSIGENQLSLKVPDTDDFIDGSKTLPSEIEEYIVNTFNTAENCLYGNTTPTLGSAYSKYLDLDSFVDYLIINEFTMNTDSILQNFSSYIYFDPSIQKFCMGPLWDFDIAMGNYDGSNTDISILKYENSRWLKKLMQHPYFKALVKDRWNETKDALYNAITSYFPELVQNNKMDAELNFKRWDVLGKKLSFSPSDCGNRTTYESEIDYLEKWLTERYSYLDEVINGYNSQETLNYVDYTNTNPDVYYNFDDFTGGTGDMSSDSKTHTYIHFLNCRNTTDGLINNGLKNVKGNNSCFRIYRQAKGEMSASVWFKLDSVPETGLENNWHYVMSMSNKNYSLQYSENTGEFQLMLGNKFYTLMKYDEFCNTFSDWQLVTVVLSDKTKQFKLYIGDKLFKTLNYDSRELTNVLMLGYESYKSIDSSWDNLRMYDRCLTEEEINRIYSDKK